MRAFDVTLDHQPGGSTLLRCPDPLPAYPRRLTERLEHWATHAPGRVFLAEPSGDGWREITYADALAAVRSIAQALIDRRLGPDNPVMILSGNDIEHALLGLACLHAGLAYAPISTAYSLLGSDRARLRQMAGLLTPGLVFAADAASYAAALDAVAPPGIEVVVARGERPGATRWADLLATKPGAEVARRAATIGADTAGKLLFTSGSTGSPKAVINTHGMMSSNQAMIGACFPFLADEPPVLVDWLPWSHTFGGNHNFNLVLYNGGTLYLDAGRPLPGQFAPTVAALRRVAPTLYLTVPKGWEELARHLRNDTDLRRMFYSRLLVPFYAAASLAQPVWDELARLSRDATGAVLPMVTGLGSTETAPMALCSGPDASRAGHVGLPVPGVVVKLAPVQRKLEARIKGPSVTPGYWRDPARTAALFDDEGFLRMGDAVAWVDPATPALGLRFDGRLGEDFKLASGTWVSAGPLRSRLIAALAPHVRDIVLTGHDRDSLAALALPADPAAIADPAVREAVAAALRALAAQATGSATRVARLAWLASPPSMEAGEITDKGSLNQAAILRRRPDEVAALHADPPGAHVIRADMKPPTFRPPAEGGGPLIEA